MSDPAAEAREYLRFVEQDEQGPLTHEGEIIAGLLDALERAERALEQHQDAETLTGVPHGRLLAVVNGLRRKVVSDDALALLSWAEVQLSRERQALASSSSRVEDTPRQKEEQ
jgi:hypothetical protein